MKRAASSERQPELLATAWVGDPTKVTSRSESHYGAVRVAHAANKSTLVTLGDAVEVKSDAKRPYLGLVEDLWEDGSGAKNMKLRWFYYQQDVQDVDPKLLSSKPPKQSSGSRAAAAAKPVRPRHPQEVFFSDVRDTNDVELVLRRATIVGGKDAEAPPRESKLPNHTYFVCETFQPQKAAFAALPKVVLDRALAHGRGKLAKAGSEVSTTSNATAEPSLTKKPSAAETAVAAATLNAAPRAPDIKKRKRPPPQQREAQDGAKGSSGEKGQSSSGGGGGSGVNGSAAVGGGRGANNKGKVAAARTASGSGSRTAEVPAAAASGGSSSSSIGGSSGGGDGSAKRQRQANGGGTSSSGSSTVSIDSEPAMSLASEGAVAATGTAAAKLEAIKSPIFLKQPDVSSGAPSLQEDAPPMAAATAAAATAAAAAAAAAAAKVAAAAAGAIGAAKEAAKTTIDEATKYSSSGAASVVAAEPLTLALPQVSPHLTSCDTGISSVPSFCVSPIVGMLRRPSLALSTQSADDLGGDQAQQQRAEIRIGDEFQAAVPSAPSYGPHADAGGPEQLAKEEGAAAADGESGGVGGGGTAMEVDDDGAAATTAAGAGDAVASGRRAVNDDQLEQEEEEDKVGPTSGPVPAVWWPGVLEPAATEDYLVGAVKAERLTEGTAVVVTVKGDAKWPPLKRWAIVERDLLPIAGAQQLGEEGGRYYSPSGADANAGSGCGDGEGDSSIDGGIISDSSGKERSKSLHDVVLRLPAPLYDEISGGTIVRITVPRALVSGRLTEDVALKLLAERGGNAALALKALLRDPALALGGESKVDAESGISSREQKGDAEAEQWSRKQVEKLLEVLEEAGDQGPTLDALASVPDKTTNQVVAFLYRFEPGCGFEPELQTLYAPRALGWRCQRATGQPAVGGRRLLSRPQQKELTDEMAFLRRYSQPVVHPGDGWAAARMPGAAGDAVPTRSMGAGGNYSGGGVVHRAKTNGIDGSKSRRTTGPKPPRKEMQPVKQRGGNPYLDRLKADLPKEEAESIMVVLSQFHKRAIGKEGLIRHMYRVLRDPVNPIPDTDIVVNEEATFSTNASAAASAGSSSGRSHRRELLEGFAALLSSPEDQLLFRRCCREEEAAAAAEAAEAAVTMARKRHKQQEVQQDQQQLRSQQLQPPLECN